MTRPEKKLATSAPKKKRRRRKKNPHAYISPVESMRAIYMDFEGFQDKSPCLMGILIEGKFEQVVFDEKLASAASAKNMRVVVLTEEIQRLVDLCKREGRLLVAYSQHELNVILKYADIDVTGVYRDARMIARKWKTMCYGNSKNRCRSLKDYLALIDYPRGRYLGERQSTSRIKAVIDMLEKRGEYADLTPVAKAKWTKLLEHNEIDCRGMEALILKAANETMETVTKR